MTEFWTLQSDFILLRETSSLETNLKIISEKFLSGLFKPRKENSGWHIHCHQVYEVVLWSWNLLLFPFPCWVEWNKTALNQRQFRLDITKNFLATRIVTQRNSSKGNWELFFMIIKKKKKKGRKKKKIKKKEGELSPVLSAKIVVSAPQVFLLVSLLLHWLSFSPSVLFICLGQERLLQFWPHNLETIAKGRLKINWMELGAVDPGLLIPYTWRNLITQSPGHVVRPDSCIIWGPNGGIMSFCAEWKWYQDRKWVYGGRIHVIPFSGTGVSIMWITRHRCGRNGLPWY